MTSLTERPVMTAPATLKPEDRPVEDLATALDTAAARLTELDRLGRQVANDLKSASDDAHRAALVRIVRRLREDPRGKELLFELVDDPAVRLVLLMHEIIRPDPMTQARAALGSIRPQLQSHGGDVELVRVEDGVAYVRLQGACNGCSMAAVTMRNGVEEALKAAVPGIGAVQVVPNEPGPAFVPLTTLGRGTTAPPEPEAGWTRTLSLDRFGPGEIVRVEIERGQADVLDAVVVNVGGQLSAYVNACAHMGLAIDEAELDVEAGSLTCPWHGYVYDALSGESRSLPGTQLEQLPLRVEDGHVWIRSER